MNKRLKVMMEKSSFAAYQLTENGCLEILGQQNKVVDNYLLFDGKHYYYGNPLVQLSSATRDYSNFIMASTATKLLIPQDTEDYLYVARNHVANKNFLSVVLYCYDNYIYYLIVSGKGSGRVHPVYLSFSEEAYKFCFYFAVEAIAAVDPEMAETLYTTITQKCYEAKKELSECEY